MSILIEIIQIILIIVTMIFPYAQLIFNFVLFSSNHVLAYWSAAKRSCQYDTHS